MLIMFALLGILTAFYCLVIEKCFFSLSSSEDPDSFCHANPAVSAFNSVNSTYNVSNVLSDNCEQDLPINYPYPQFRYTVVCTLSASLLCQHPPISSVSSGSLNSIISTLVSIHPYPLYRQFEQHNQYTSQHSPISQVQVVWTALSVNYSASTHIPSAGSLSCIISTLVSIHPYPQYRQFEQHYQYTSQNSPISPVQAVWAALSVH
jgi:hypothetical protein